MGNGNVILNFMNLLDSQKPLINVLFVCTKVLNLRVFCAFQFVCLKHRKSGGYEVDYKQKEDKVRKLNFTVISLNLSLGLNLLQ